jgi:hypothetical protein
MRREKKNLWILTEERPKTNVLEMILSYFAKDKKCGFFGDNLRIIPLLDENKRFDFTYKVLGFSCARVDNVYIKIVSGYSSFVDFLVFYQEAKPQETDVPLYAIEETKTDDKESRNTGVYQRCSKFVYLQNYYPNTKMIMLYALQIEQKTRPTETYIFGTRLLLTMGVDILGKKLSKEVFTPFTSIEELIEYKNSMRLPPKGNIPILIKKTTSKIQVSGRLIKNNSLSHDPNIGALSIIVYVLRKLGWKNTIEITQHGLSQTHIKENNKFIQIATKLDLKLQGLNYVASKPYKNYWYYDLKGEKLATIFLHIIVENFTEGYSIFENHAGCEKGYFKTSAGEYIPLVKYTDREKYKNGDKKQIVYIPDLVLLDIKETKAITIEGKKYEYRKKAIAELKNYKAFDKLYLKKYYSAFKIVRTVVLYGGKQESLQEIEVGFLLNANGKLVLGIKAPKLFKRAIKNLLDYWK